MLAWWRMALEAWRIKGLYVRALLLRTSSGANGASRECAKRAPVLRDATDCSNESKRFSNLCVPNLGTELGP